jgi:hypothetical protein
MNKTINVTIKGVYPLLMHRMPLVNINGLDKLPAEEQAEHAAYRMPDGMLYIPGTNIQRAIISGATYSKGKSRASLQKPVAACVLVTPEHCTLGVKDYIVDSRTVVIPATKGRIVRHRPRLDEWKVSFTVEYDPVLLTEEQLRTVVDDTGARVGLLDFRPEHKGPFGRFMVTEWSK